MAHFAKIENDIVTNVIVAEEDYVKGLEGEWLQTSYNTRHGVHRLGGIPFRYNYAGIGFTYDRNRDAFIEPKLFPSWILNEQTCSWEAPVLRPENTDPYDHWVWNEDTLSWINIKN